MATSVGCFQSEPRCVTDNGIKKDLLDFNCIILALSVPGYHCCGDDDNWYYLLYSYSVWKHVACNKLQISEDLAWL